jgi:hypothetical protein
MADDYVVQLDTREGFHFEAELDKKRFEQWDTKRISPANRTVSPFWHLASNPK